MKDMFGRELNKWDVVCHSSYNGNFYISVVLYPTKHNDRIWLRRISLDFQLLDDYIASPDHCTLMSIPEDLKIKLDTMKFADEEI